MAVSGKPKIYVTANCWSNTINIRIHEVLARDQDTYDPLSTLLVNDVTLHKTKEEGKELEFLSVHLKSAKEQKLSKGVRVELFATDSFICPVSFS